MERITKLAKRAIKLKCKEGQEKCKEGEGCRCHKNRKSNKNFSFQRETHETKLKPQE